MRQRLTSLVIALLVALVLPLGMMAPTASATPLPASCTFDKATLTLTCTNPPITATLNCQDRTVVIDGVVVPALQLPKPLQKLIVRVCSELTT